MTACLNGWVMLAGKAVCPLFVQKIWKGAGRQVTRGRVDDLIGIIEPVGGALAHV